MFIHPIIIDEPMELPTTVRRRRRVMQVDLADGIEDDIQASVFTIDKAI
jgi:hypothetical protein